MPQAPAVPRKPEHVCIAITRTTARVVIRRTTPGHPIAWPMLITDPCPFSADCQPWEIPRPHAHVHYMTEPGPWWRVAPCCRKPYLISLEPAA
jgi:hypothetical protein